MKLAVIGSRNFNDYEQLKKEINNLSFSKDINEIISGGARGADSLAEKYANEYRIKLTVFKPDWNIGKHAVFLRNTQIIESSDAVIAFWDGQSKGTLDSLNKAKKLNKIVVIINQGEL
jgi:predicted Rossmann fold nucleotide-binding protein DprA/Smf involved in DNA uptake